MTPCFDTEICFFCPGFACLTIFQPCLSVHQSDRLVVQAFKARSQAQNCRNVSLSPRSSTHTSKMLISLTVGKVDAGVAVLLTQDKRLVCTLPAHRTRRNSWPSLHTIKRLTGARSSFPLSYCLLTFPPEVSSTSPSPATLPLNRNPKLLFWRFRMRSTAPLVNPSPQHPSFAVEMLPRHQLS